MKKYIEAQNVTNDIVLANKLSNDEIDRFATSDLRWAKDRNKSLQKRNIKKGEIYQIEFGKNYVPEMSYEHRGLIIGVKHKLLYVLPIFSYDPQKHNDVYHPIDFPDSKSNYYLLKSTENKSIKHDSLIKLNDIRTVSINRVLYKHNDKLNVTSDVYMNIESLVLQKYFANFHHEYIEGKKQIEEFKQKVTDLESDIQTLTIEKEKLEKEILELKKLLNTKDQA